MTVDINRLQVGTYVIFHQNVFVTPEWKYTTEEHTYNYQAAFYGHKFCQRYKPKNVALLDKGFRIFCPYSKLKYNFWKIVAIIKDYSDKSNGTYYFLMSHERDFIMVSRATLISSLG